MHDKRVFRVTHHIIIISLLLVATGDDVYVNRVTDLLVCRQKSLSARHRSR